MLSFIWKMTNLMLTKARFQTSHKRRLLCKIYLTLQSSKNVANMFTIRQTQIYSQQLYAQIYLLLLVCFPKKSLFPFFSVFFKVTINEVQTFLFIWSCCSFQKRWKDYFVQIHSFTFLILYNFKMCFTCFDIHDNILIQ